MGALSGTSSAARPWLPWRWLSEPPLQYSRPERTALKTRSVSQKWPRNHTQRWIACVLAALLELKKYGNFFLPPWIHTDWHCTTDTYCVRRIHLLVPGVSTPAAATVLSSSMLSPGPPSCSRKQFVRKSHEGLQPSLVRGERRGGTWLLVYMYTGTF